MTRVGSLGKGRLRALRGLILAAACLGIPAAAHLLVSHDFPFGGPYLLVAGLFSGMCVALADRRRSLAEIGVVVALSQPVLHVLLSLSGHGGDPIWTGGWPMAFAHAAAAAVVTGLLAGAERLLWCLASLRDRLLARLVPEEPRPVSSRRVVISGTEERRLYALILCDSARRRGPPVVTPA
jgi:hypothetical protein